MAGNLVTIDANQVALCNGVRGLKFVLERVEVLVE